MRIKWVKSYRALKTISFYEFVIPTRLWLEKRATLRIFTFLCIAISWAFGAYRLTAEWTNDLNRREQTLRRFIFHYWFALVRKTWGSGVLFVVPMGSHGYKAALCFSRPPFSSPPWVPPVDCPSLRGTDCPSWGKLSGDGEILYLCHDKTLQGNRGQQEQTLATQDTEAEVQNTVASDCQEHASSVVSAGREQALCYTSVCCCSSPPRAVGN